MNLLTIKGFKEIINNQKLIYSIYAFCKSIYRNNRGRKHKVSLLYQIIITIFKLKYNLPDRVLEKLLNIDHVTISRIVNRISIHLGNLRLPNMDTKTNYYVVDTTTIRVGRGKKKETYSGYKNYHGLKYQVICDSESNIIEVSKGYEASIHDKKNIFKRIQRYKR